MAVRREGWAAVCGGARGRQGSLCPSALFCMGLVGFSLCPRFSEPGHRPQLPWPAAVSACSGEGRGRELTHTFAALTSYS